MARFVLPPGSKIQFTGDAPADYVSGPGVLRVVADADREQLQSIEGFEAIEVGTIDTPDFSGEYVGPLEFYRDDDSGPTVHTFELNEDTLAMLMEDRELAEMVDSPPELVEWLRLYHGIEAPPELQGRAEGLDAEGRQVVSFPDEATGIGWQFPE